MINNVDLCYGLDLRPGYRNHFYAYISVNISFDNGKLYIIMVYTYFSLYSYNISM